MKLRMLMTASLMATTLTASQAQTTTTRTTQTPTTETVTTTTKIPKASSAHPAKKAKAHRETAEEIQLRELKASMQAQQDQIDALKSQLATKDGQLTTTQQTAADAAAQAASAAAAAQAAQSAAQADSTKVDAVSSSVTDLKSTTAGLTDTVINNQKTVQAEINSPTTIHYKGVTIQPIGFAAAETIVRTRTMNSNISTPFNSTPYMNSANAHLTEFNGSAQQSRIGALILSPDLSFGKAFGYFETDFLGAGTTSNSNQTNSYLLRVREIFGGITTHSGFTFEGGQMFTLATEAKKGAVQSYSTEAIPTTIDPQYHVGFNFARQYEIRMVQSLFADKVNVALALDESQIVLATTVNAPDNFFFGGQGSASGLFNSTGNGSTAQNYSNNVAPDIIAKVTFDPGFGHFEIGGILRFFRDRVYPQTAFCTAPTTTGTCVQADTSTTGTNFTTPGGGVFVSARLPVSKYFAYSAKLSAGDGTARYGTSNLGDVTVRPSGLLEPLRDAQGLTELSFHATKKLDILGIAGFEYLQRTTYIAPTGVQVGYGVITGQNDTGCSTQSAPTADNGYSFGAGGTCSGATRDVHEGSTGFLYRFYNSPTKGRFQFEALYSFLERNAWTGYTNGTSYATATTFGSPKATNNIFYTSFRYYLP